MLMHQNEKKRNPKEITVLKPIPSGKLRVSSATSKLNFSTTSLNTVSATDPEKLLLERNSKMLPLPTYSRHYSETYLKCKKYFENRKVRRRTNNELRGQMFPCGLAEESFDSLGKGRKLPPITDDIKAQEKEMIPFISETDLPIRLPKFLMLPRLYCQHQFHLRARNFTRDEEFLKTISGDGIDWEDIKYCRYLRIPKQRKQDKYMPKVELDRNNRYGKYFFS